MYIFSQCEVDRQGKTRPFNFTQRETRLLTSSALPYVPVQVNVPEFSEAISVLNLIGDIYFFSGLSLSHARGLLEVGFKKRYAAGEIIVGKDSPITDFCVLLVGLLEVTYDEDPENEPYKVHKQPVFGSTSGLGSP